MGVGASAGHVPPTEGNASGLRTMTRLLEHDTENLQVVGSDPIEFCVG